MRLGQLSRKISVSYSEILDYLENDLGVHVDASLNSKIDDAHVNTIIEHFSPKVVEEEIIEIEEPSPIEELIDDENLEIKTVELDEEVETTTDDEKAKPEADTEKNVETIKAKAERLEGLTVIGKIDLPPPPPPEMIEIDGVMYDKADIKRQKREEKEQRKQDAIRRREERKRVSELKELESTKSDVIQVEDKKVKPDLSFEKQRIKEAKEIEKRKLQEEKARREKQRKHYEEKHKVPAETIKRKKVIKKEKVVEEQTPIDLEDLPTSMLGKFWRWLTTY